ncbi:hypothetical protein [Ligilactobacillus salivarius]|uniref:Uncharacterized protein n=1 Tax=Ligilactobacillus salivarius TaxID=1624 RepID=A0A1V9U1T2_9LACO|nr:hypothetical protein [Ligilactobacillus salivarius]OQR21970.1 hypothetical protein B6U39_02730 [Ligilactobacillus salivarius]OQR23816.1 hypothetical protein B6U38_02755 [Ligilactobacillus salivarius]OQR25802.1 hypothetical protein B6U37_02740 [Ligilactobacillus salivarius]
MIRFIIFILGIIMVYFTFKIAFKTRNTSSGKKYLFGILKCVVLGTIATIFLMFAIVDPDDDNTSSKEASSVHSTKKVTKSSKKETSSSETSDDVESKNSSDSSSNDDEKINEAVKELNEYMQNNDLGDFAISYEYGGYVVTVPSRALSVTDNQQKAMYLNIYNAIKGAVKRKTGDDNIGLVTFKDRYGNTIAESKLLGNGINLK